jgi:hypothetical protein
MRPYELAASARGDKTARIIPFVDPSGGRSLAEFKINASSDET